ncbi:MAG TPA: homoserine dehydrogenase, partial [Acetobacteraceae bacterium]|nr:homoserine dehydrogenase [Acetobacteraceae bacterium]
MTTPLRIGVAGLGTVGAGVVALLAQNAELIAQRAGRPIIVRAVSARNRDRDRGISLAGFTWTDDP